MHITGFFLRKSFEKQYSKQSPNVQRAFVERRNMLLIDPSHPILNNHALNGKYEGFRSINVTGDIRAVYEIHGTVGVFVFIDSHSNLYR